MRHGDSLILLHEVEDESVDLVLTDPPYSSGGMFRGDRAARTTGQKYVDTGALDQGTDFDGDTRDQRGFLAWASLWLAECWRTTKVGGSCLIFTDWRQLPTMTDAVQAGGFVYRGIVVWDKGGAGGKPRRGFRASAEFLVWGTRGAFSDEVYLPGVVRATAPRSAVRLHQTEKPIGLLEQLVGACPPGGLVLDPFAGSGSTLEAARNKGRRALGFELNDHYIETAAKRLDQMSLEAA